MGWLRSWARGFQNRLVSKGAMRPPSACRQKAGPGSCPLSASRLSAPFASPSQSSTRGGFTDWREMNSSLFAAHRWLTLSLFVVLSLVVAVASFQVSSALVVLAIDKQRSSGMLQALGATPARIRRVLVFSGLLLGGTGVAGGIAFGCLVSWIMTATRAIRFPPGLARVYMVDSIPLVPTFTHVAAIAGICLIIVFLSSIWPAWKTSRQDPVTSLRAA